MCPRLWVAPQQATPRATSASGAPITYPAVIEPESGLARRPTGEILIQLKPQSDPRKYFGEDWAKVKRLAGTDDHFILPMSLATDEQLIGEAIGVPSTRRWPGQNLITCPR